MVASDPKKRSPLPATLILLGVAVFSFLAYRYGEHWLRRILIYLSHATWARNLVSGMPLAERVAGRFVAGETIDEAITTASQLNSKGMMVAMDYLGESVTDVSLAKSSKDEILRLLDFIAQSGVEAYVSVKLTQLGLRIDRALALENLRQILERARATDNRVRVDMEESQLVDPTLELYRTLRYEEGFDNVGVVIQAYLYRSVKDVEQLIEEGAWVRLCKGAYAEPPDVAFPDKADTDANYVRLTQMLLSERARQKGVRLAIATHDEKMIQAAIDYASMNHISPEEYEFQMLFGVRRELQELLVSQGYRVRVYVPYGTAWYPYFVRRLAERPANLWFFFTNLLRS